MDPEGLSRPGVWDMHSEPFATFHWPKQVTGQPDWKDEPWGAGVVFLWSHRSSDISQPHVPERHRPLTGHAL